MTCVTMFRLFIGSSGGSDRRRTSKVIPISDLESPESGIECM